ncbi:heme-binding protein [Candidatus Gracilibacteria bacterium]|nr:heme-binding protein [Candidatus Gracilibacteria bacterium]
MKASKLGLGIGTAALTGIGAWVGLSYYAIKDIESPEYNLIEKKGKYEIREYKEYIVAETTVSGTHKDAMNNGFRTLATYIFGGNTSNDSIAMTSPVMEMKSEKISMTSPVMNTKSGDEHLIQFTMPSSYTLASLPIPDSDEVNLRTIPRRTVAVLRYSGYNSAKIIEKKKRQLLSFLELKDVEYNGPVTSAGYNPPLSFPLMRRNEVMVEISL